MTAGRLGSYSTRTTHPQFIHCIQEIMKVLDIKIPLTNPFKYMSKGEVLKKCSNQNILKDGFNKTISCAHPGAGRWKGFGYKNCGYCYPCLIRRASAYSIGVDNPGTYQIDALTIPDFINSSNKSLALRSILFCLSRENANTKKNNFQIFKNGLLAEETPNSIKYLDAYQSGIKELYNLINEKACDEVKQFAKLNN